MGELRERRRLALPLVVAPRRDARPGRDLPGPQRRPASASGWGAAMSTDTAFALGLLALVGSGRPRPGAHLPAHLRASSTTLPGSSSSRSSTAVTSSWPRCWRRRSRSSAVRARAAPARRPVRPGLPAARRRRLGRVLRIRHRPGRRRPGDGPAHATPTRPRAATWSGPSRLCSGCSASSRPRSWPATARESVRLAISPNDRLQQLFHPWTSYLIVPLFALANAGITVSGSFLARAFTSPVTLGILLGYVLGQAGRAPLGAAWLLDPAQPGPDPAAGRLGGRRPAPARSRASASPSPCSSPRSPSTAPSWPRPRSGILSAALCASALSWAVFRITALLPAAAAAPRAARHAPTPSSTSPSRSTPSGTTSAARPGRRSRSSSTATSSARTAARPSPWSASCSPTSATSGTCGGTCRSPTCTRTPSSPPRPPRPPPAQGKFWEMHDLLLEHQDALTASDLIRYAGELGLDTDRFTARSARARRARPRSPQTWTPPTCSGVSGTPDLLHQRQAPPWRLRHRHALRRGPGGPGTHPDQLAPPAPPHILTSQPARANARTCAASPYSAHHSRCGISARFEERS